MSDPFVAMVLLRRPASFNCEAVITEFRRQRLGFTERVEAAAGPGGGRSFVLTIGSNLVTVMVLDMPLPQGTLDRAITGNLLWPDAGPALSGDKAHVIVASLGRPQDIAGRVTAASNVTWVCAAIAALTSSLCIYWAPSETVCAPKQFQADAARMSVGIWPATLWVRLYFFADKARGTKECTGCVTMGLLSFVEREIEFEPAPLAPGFIAEKVLGTAFYLLSHGSVLKHGDTLGANVAERIRISHADNGERVSLPVLRLVYEANNMSSLL